MVDVQQVKSGPPHGGHPSEQRTPVTYFTLNVAELDVVAPSTFSDSVNVPFLRNPFGTVSAIAVFPLGTFRVVHAIVFLPNSSRTVTLAPVPSVTVVCTRQLRFLSAFSLSGAGALIVAFSTVSTGFAITVIVDGVELVVLPRASVAETVTAYTPGALYTWVTVLPCAEPSPRFQTGSATFEPCGSIAETEKETSVPTTRSRGMESACRLGPVMSIVTGTATEDCPMLPARSTARTV